MTTLAAEVDQEEAAGLGKSNHFLFFLPFYFGFIVFCVVQPRLFSMFVG